MPRGRKFDFVLHCSGLGDDYHSAIVGGAGKSAGGTKSEADGCVEAAFGRA